MSKRLGDIHPAVWFLCLMCFLLFLYLTKYGLSFQESIEWVQATDVDSYLILANSAPEFPSVKIGYHFSQRWVPHYMTGWLAKAIPCDIEMSYGLLNGLVVILITYSAKQLLVTKNGSNSVEYIALLFFLFSAYTFRLYVFVPGLFADLVYVLGVAIALNGCRWKKFYLIVIGMVIATLGKQLAILILPGMLFYVFGAWGKNKGKATAFKLCFMLLSVVTLTYGLLVFTSRGFALENSITFNVLFSIIPWFMSNKFTAGLLGEHLLRIVLPLAPMILVWILIPVAFEIKLKQLMSWESIGLLLIVLGPIAYAFLPGPLVQMGNQSRYVASSLLPLALLLIRTLPASNAKLRGIDWAFLPLILLLLSYHHRYTLIQSTPEIFMVVQVVVLALIGAWVLYRKDYLRTTMIYGSNVNATQFPKTF